MNIKEIQEVKAPSQVTKLQATVVEADAPYNGKSQYGPYVLQVAKLADSTGQIRAAFYDPKRDLQGLKGKVVEIVSGTTSKGKFSGITAIDYTDEGTTTRQLKVSKFATIDEIVPEDKLLKGMDIGGNPTSETEPASDIPLTAYQPYVDNKSASIEKQVALKAAVELYGGMSPELIDDDVLNKVVKAAHKFYDEVFASKSNGSGKVI
jgi:hypothetical protein